MNLFYEFVELISQGLFLVIGILVHEICNFLNILSHLGKFIKYRLNFTEQFSKKYFEFNEFLQLFRLFHHKVNWLGPVSFHYEIAGFISFSKCLTLNLQFIITLLKFLLSSIKLLQFWLNIAELLPLFFGLRLDLLGLRYRFLKIFLRGLVHLTNRLHLLIQLLLDLGHGLKLLIEDIFLEFLVSFL